MSELRVVAVITAKPGSAEAMGQALQTLAEATRQEPGCISYELFTSDAPDTFLTVEAWQDPADLQSHLSSPHLVAAMQAGAELFAAPPAIHQLRPLG